MALKSTTAASILLFGGKAQPRVIVTPPDSSGGTTDTGGFTNPPVVTLVSGGVTAGGTTTVKGRVKTGSYGAMLYNITTPVAGSKYTLEYTPDFTQLSQQGKLAMVGFGFKTNNSFFIIGLRGDGSTGLHVYRVSGSPPNGWNKLTGQTVINGSAPANGTQAGPNYLQVEVSSDGTTLTFRTSADGSTWADELTSVSLGPFANVSNVLEFGPAAWISNADTGLFSVTFSLWSEATASSAAFDAFQARASLTGSDATNYQNLLDGLTSDGFFNSDGTSSKLDALYILAAPSSTVALMNLVKNAYNLTPAGGVINFTANQGYLSVGGWLGTGFNPVTAVSATYQLQSAHCSSWIRTNNGTGGNASGLVGSTASSGAENSVIFAQYNPNSAFFRSNASGQGSPVTISQLTGHYLATRTGASAEFGYINAVDQSVTPVTADSALHNAEMLMCGWDGSGGNGYQAGQVSAGSIGAGLSASDVTKLHARLSTFLTAVGAI